MNKLSILGILAIALLLGSCSKDDDSADKPKDPTKTMFTVKGVTFKMVKVDGGTFTMGATPEQAIEAESNEKPAHKVTLSGYRIGQTEVTQALWQAVMGSNPSYFKGNNRPVEKVSWKDCQTFISKLNNLTGETFRLPTEAEWEFACRGGNKSKSYRYSGSNNINDVAWHSDNCLLKGEGSPDYGTHDVATKQPNELGIYDMSGNVWEWCQDWYGENYYSNSPQTNPKGPSSGLYRVDRGGSWYHSVKCLRSAQRDHDNPSLGNEYCGLRLAL